MDICFVCDKEIKKGSVILNKEVMLKVCKKCTGTSAEKKKTEEYLDSLADGLICGCI